MNKTRRGVYLNIDESPIAVEQAGNIYKFSSFKKRAMFLKRTQQAVESVKKLQGKIYKFTGTNEDYSLDTLIKNIYANTYRNMQYK